MTPLATLASLLCPLLLLLTLGYAAVCAASPFGPCRRCEGTGRLGARIRRACPRCDATGLRIRAGRHLWNEINRIHREGSR